MTGSHFSMLMAQSKQQTELVQAQAKAQLEAKQRREAEKAREQAERERRAKEAEERMRQRHFEEQRREKERQEKRAQEKEAEARREAQRERVREAVLLGKGGKPGRSRSGGGRGGGGWGRAKKKTDEEDDGSVGGGGALTREEKRARRMENEFRMPGSSRSRLPTPKTGKRLPGGALPSNLIGSNSRGSRTIDDALRDRDRGKTVSGNSARPYDGSFSDSRLGKSSPDKLVGAAIPKKTAVGRDPAASAPKRTPLPLARPGSTPASSKAVPKKRSHSFSEESDYDSSPLPRKRPASGAGGGSDVRNMIWNMFGKQRDAYVGRDDLSDDENMEAGAFDVEREEKRSAKLARQEDMEAELEEKRREEEKRRRRMSKA